MNEKVGIEKSERVYILSLLLLLTNKPKAKGVLALVWTVGPTYPLFF